MDLRAAFRGGGSVAVTVELVAAIGGVRPPAISGAADLLAWLRSPPVLPLVKGRQDVLLIDEFIDPTGDVAPAGSGPIELIAAENQWLWQAHLPSEAVDSADGAVVHIIDEEAGKHLGSLDLGDFLLRMVAAALVDRHPSDGPGWISARVENIDPASLDGPPPVTFGDFRLNQIAIGDQWIYRYWPGSTHNKLHVLHHPGEGEAHARSRLEDLATNLGGRLR